MCSPTLLYFFSVIVYDVLRYSGVNIECRLHKSEQSAEVDRSSGQFHCLHCPNDGRIRCALRQPRLSPVHVSWVRHCIVLYSSTYIAPLNSRGPTEALLIRLAPRKETSFKK